MSGINQNNLFLGEIISNLQANIMANAPFNRDYVWTQEDVIMFFESIQKGYPIGNIITWTPDEERDWNERIGPFEVSEKPMYYIVDGHNRLATLAYSMVEPFQIERVVDNMSEQEKLTWGSGNVLVYDSLLDEVKFLTSNEYKNYQIQEHVRNTLPVGVLASRSFNDYLRRHQNRFDIENDVIFENMDNMAQKIRETKLVNLHLDKIPAHEAIDAFTHLAKVGQPMNHRDIERAREWFETSPAQTFKM